MSVQMSVLVVCATLLLLGCEGRKDVTKDPAYGFATMAGTKWKLKKPLVFHEGAEGEFCTEEYAAQYAAGKADPSEFGLPILGVLPSGTIIQMDCLITGGGEMGGYDVFLGVLTGKYKGQTVFSPNKLFLPNAFLNPGESKPKTWAINPEYLEKP